MPIVRIELLEGRSVEQKRACAAAITRAMVETCGATPQATQVIFVDVARQDWATAGHLASDPKPG